MQSLRDHRARQRSEREAAGENWVDHDFVFTNENGGPVSRNILATRNFRRVLEAAGLPQIRLYDLRYTAAITLDIYSHILPYMQDEAAQKMESLVLGGEPVVKRKSGTRHTLGTQRAN